MFDLIQSVVAFMRKSSTGFLPFLGEALVGNNNEMGPYLNVRPESSEQHQKPYIVYNIFPNGLDQGFGGVGASFGEKPILRFHLFDADSDRVTKNMDFFSGKMDVLGTNDLIFLGPDSFLGLLRRESPFPTPEPVGQRGRRWYHWVVSYEFRVARNKGTLELRKPTVA